MTTLGAIPAEGMAPSRPSGGAPGPDRATLEESLHPIVDALREEARHRSEDALARADEDADAVLRAAREEGDRILADARAEGEALAGQLSASLVADARRVAHEQILEAQRRLYEMVRQAAVRELEHRSESPGVGQLFARLESVVRARLGADAVVSRAGDGRVGVVGERDGLRVDLSAPVLVDLQLRSFNDVLEEFWG